MSIEILYTKEQLAERTGFSPRIVALLAQEGRLPVYSRKPLRFRVKDTEPLLTEAFLQRYRAADAGRFEGFGTPRGEKPL